MTLRVVFAEDNYLVREGTASLLAGVEQVELVAAVGDLGSLLAAVEEHHPDAVLTDIRMPPSNSTEGIEAARRIRAEHPDTGVVVVEVLVARKDRLAHSPLALLTDREREVLDHMAQGKNNAAIARSRFLTERAVEKHINSLFHKLGLSEKIDVHRRVMAVLAFLREGGVPRPTAGRAGRLPVGGNERAG
jgi:DNA-binding NarL/FixJ family response regulator